jgi:hypothetical protein
VVELASAGGGAGCAKALRQKHANIKMLSHPNGHRCLQFLQSSTAYTKTSSS